MKMTSKLANQLMDDLCCVAISANGGVPMDENGECCITDEQLEAAQGYARAIFVSLLSTWEELMGEEWEIGDKED